jgi:hypothetical protein
LTNFFFRINPVYIFLSQNISSLFLEFEMQISFLFFSLSPWHRIHFLVRFFMCCIKIYKAVWILWKLKSPKKTEYKCRVCVYIFRHIFEWERTMTNVRHDEQWANWPILIYSQRHSRAAVFFFEEINSLTEWVIYWL